MSQFKLQERTPQTGRPQRQTFILSRCWQGWLLPLSLAMHPFSLGPSACTCVSISWCCPALPSMQDAVEAQ